MADPRFLGFDKCAAQSSEAVRKLLDYARAAEHAASGAEPEQVTFRKHWQPDYGFSSYHTHIAISGADEELFAQVVDIFTFAATLPEQPWYPQFISGSANERVGAGSDRVFETTAVFDLGLSTPRYYHQRLARHWADNTTAVLEAQSINDGSLAAPTSAKRAYTFSPNGEVFSLIGDCLHWHHICTTPGPALLPYSLDKLLMNFLRRTGLDSAERKTYFNEANDLSHWLKDRQAVADFHQQHITKNSAEEGLL